jgi:hypothetical protein
MSKNTNGFLGWMGWIYIAQNENEMIIGKTISISFSYSKQQKKAEATSRLFRISYVLTIKNSNRG